jgi:hypothetical protein
MILEIFNSKKNEIPVIITIEEGTLKVIKKRFKGLNVDFLDVVSIAISLGYDIASDMSDAAYFILSREIERLLVEKVIESQKDIVYIVPKYTPDIKRTVNDILKRNNIEADLVVGLLMI